MIYAVIDTNVIVAALLTHNPMVATAKVLDYLFPNTSHHENDTLG